MRTSTRITRISNRSNREDGDITKARIIDAAGQLCADNGYPEVTSKEICEAAGTNLAAVNYHFGSREGLYCAVLKTMHDFITSPNFLSDLEKSDISPKEKLSQLLNRLTHMIYENDSWQVRLWVREMVSPTGIGLRAMDENVIPNFGLMHRLLRQLTGLEDDSPLLEMIFLHAMSPIMVMMLMKNTRHKRQLKILTMNFTQLSEDLQELVFSGLDAFAKKKICKKEMTAMESST